MTNKFKLAWSYISDVLLSSVRRILTTVLFFITTVVEVDILIWLVSLILFIELWEDK